MVHTGNKIAFTNGYCNNERAGARKLPILHWGNDGNTSGHAQIANLTMRKATKYKRARANCQFGIEETTETRAGMRKRPI